MEYISTTTMKKLVSLIFERLMRRDKKVLGRWSIDYCDKRVNNKIDLSNEDHCGPCGQYDVVNKKSFKVDLNQPPAKKNK
jgi:hypothetical protein